MVQDGDERGLLAVAPHQGRVKVHDVGVVVVVAHVVVLPPARVGAAIRSCGTKEKGVTRLNQISDPFRMMCKVT